MKYRKYIEKERVDEAGFFRDLYSVIKVGKQIAKIGESTPKVDKKDLEAYSKVLQSTIEKGLSIIEKANMSKEIKASMRKGFLSGVFGKLEKETSDMLELKTLFNFNQTLFGEMYRAWENER